MPQLSYSSTDQLLIQTRWVSMCGSDIPFFTGSKRFRSYPLPTGFPIHECVGQVVESTSSLFRSGDQVIAIPDGNQGLAEFFVAQAARAVQLPTALAGRDTSCLIQPLATVMNAVDGLQHIEGRSIAVVGLGSIGLFFCWLLKKRGAGRIVGIDPLAHRCQLAESLGATRTYPLRSIEVVHAARQQVGGWDYPEICIEAVGHQMDTLNDCFELVRKRGTIIAFGVPDQPVYAIEFETFFRKNAHLIAVVTPEWREYLAKACDLFGEYRTELEMLVTHRFAIQEAEQAFTLYERHEQGIVKAVLEVSWPQADRD
jgi:threonine dehydrogenase-like Zn-dependent dehydrogenase